MEALAEQPDAQWLRDLGIQFRLDYGSRPLHTSGLDSSRAYVGLRNLGNSCYLNSLLQCFYGCGSLREDVSRQSPPKGALAVRVQHLFQQLSGKDGKWDYVSPAAVLHQVFLTDEAAFQPGESADVFDCCHLLLDSCLSHPGLFLEPFDRPGGSSQCLGIYGPVGMTAVSTTYKAGLMSRWMWGFVPWGHVLPEACGIRLPVQALVACVAVGAVLIGGCLHGLRHKSRQEDQDIRSSQDISVSAICCWNWLVPEVGFQMGALRALLLSAVVAIVCAEDGDQGDVDTNYSYNGSYDDNGSYYDYNGSYDYDYNGSGYDYDGPGHDYDYDGPGYDYNASGGYGYCAEMMCTKYKYDENGEIDWSADMETTCASYEEGCPCNEEWEVSCESWGYKVCTPKSEGCYDPFDTTCDNATEYTCRDEWSAYCWDKAWGACPIFCTSNETMCYTYAYDASGEIDWMSDYNTSCAPLAEGCPCNPTWEQKCTDEWGSWCTSKLDSCPISCGDDEQVCWSTPYGSDGYPDWSLPGNQTCQSMDQHCPCNSEHEELCVMEWGSYCQSKVYGSCPVSCTADQLYCYETPYDDNGEIDWYGTWKETCANATDGCPCHPEWEKSCGSGWCMSKFEHSPVDCGEFETCYHYISGNESCATDIGCTCEDNEHECMEDGKQRCYPKDWYSSCPITCKATEMYCSEIGFDANGMMTWTDTCEPQNDDWFCPVVCKADSAKKCGSGFSAYCIAASDECPQECTDEEQECWVTDFDAKGNWLSAKDKCAPKGQECPCGENSVRCSSNGFSYCEATYYGCPIECTADQKICYPVSYTPEGDYDWDAPINESCVAQDKTCPCGANAKLCKWTDDFGAEEEYCVPSAESCPVTCSSSQEKCFKSDYNATGYPTSFKETCVQKGTPCPCGTHSQKCTDPFFGDSYCYPKWDFWSNVRLDSTMRREIGSEICVPQNQRCDCSKGQNAFECNFTESWGTWSECLPLAGGFCPSTCPADEVPCPQVEDFMPDGTYLGLASPSKKCAASLAECPCGKQAERCPGTAGCISKSEGCPIACKAGEKKCYLTDFTDGGDFISDREVCVAADALCPCGKNTVKCPGEDVCLPKDVADVICPCKESQTTCSVVDFSTTGQVTGFSTACVAPSNPCPCGKNSLSCPDPNDAKALICTSKFSGKLTTTCPRPCTPEAEQAGNKTCIQTNLDKSGNFESETVSCLKEGSCKPGKNMKRCPTGAVIASARACQDLYGTGGKNTTAVSENQKQTSKIILTLESATKNAVANAETARVTLNSVLQLPAGLTTSVAVKSGGSGRRLSTSSTKLVYTVSNAGSTGVAPSAVGERLKNMAKSGSKELASATSTVGKVNAKAAVPLDTSVTARTSRSKAVEEQRKQQAGITTRTTTTTTTTTSGASGTTTTTTTQANNETTETTTGSDDSALIDGSLQSHLSFVAVIVAFVALAC
eukprot:s3280_g1.t1